jgi:hypothetical protein
MLVTGLFYCNSALNMEITRFNRNCRDIRRGRETGWGLNMPVSLFVIDFYLSIKKSALT